MQFTDSRQIGDRVLELMAAALLGVATVATAWCAYQAASWNDNETDEGRSLAEHRLQSSRLFNLGTQKVAYDATIAALYAQAIAQDDAALQEFYRENLIREDFLPVIEQWEQDAAAGQELTNLLDNEEYLDQQFADSAAEDLAADDAGRRVQDASDNAAGFIQTTIFLASSLFFAGITSNFRSRLVRMLMLLASSTVLAIGAARIADLPIA